MHTQKLVLTTLPKKFANVSKDSRWKSGKDKRICLDSKTFTLSRKVLSDKWIAVLKTLTKKNSVKVRSLQKNLKRCRIFFLLINTFLKTFLQGRRIQFWQLCRDFSAKRPKVVCWKCECRKKITVPSNKIFFLQNVLFWPVECRFGNRSKTNSAQIKTSLPTKWWIDEKKVIHSKSTHYFVWTGRNNFENPTEGILLVLHKRWKNLFGKKFVPKQIHLDTHNFVLTTFRERFNSGRKHFCWKVEKGRKIVFSNLFLHFPKKSHSER